MVHELLDLTLFKPGVAASVRCYHNFVVIERGADALPAEFSLASFLDWPGAHN